MVAVGFLLPVARGEATRRIRLPAPGKSISIESKPHSMEDHAEFGFQAISGTKVKIELSAAGPLRGRCGGRGVTKMLRSAGTASRVNDQRHALLGQAVRKGSPNPRPYSLQVRTT
jgi:hypothetical protein